MESVNALTKVLCELALLDQVPDRSLFETSSDGPIRTLSSLELLDEIQAIQALSKRLGVEYWDLENPETSHGFQLKEFQGKLENAFLWKHKIVPLLSDGSELFVAFANPLDLDAYRSIEFALQCSVRIVLAEELKILRLLEQYFPTKQVQFASFEEAEATKSKEIRPSVAQEENLDEHATEAAPIVRLCNKLLVDGIRAKASDIHIEPVANGLEIRHRIDGVMHNVLEVPRRLQNNVIARLKILAGMDISEKRRPQDGRLRVRAGGEKIDMRVSSIPAAFGEKLVLRILKANAGALSLESLGMPTETLGRLQRILQSRGRLLLVTGPTGSGKTTTLYSALNYLKDGKTNIVTVEDPIEYRVPGINQIQVNSTIDMTFAAALRSILRQDPDVIMIGEIRDSETAQIALQAAQTGHLVLSTLHTNDAPSAISRLLNLEVDPFVLASSLGGIMAQRLVRKLCGECKAKANVQEIECYSELIEKYRLDPKKLKAARGCDKCAQIGFQGRIGIYSYLEVSEHVSALIHEGSPISKIEKEAMRHGYLDLSRAALRLVETGVTDLSEVKQFLIQGEAPALQEPVETSVASENSPGPANDFTGSSEKSLTKEKVLLIEDDENLRSILSMVLRNEMFQVFEAQNGREGLELVYQHAPRIVLCDLMMPEMDGKEFLIKLRSNPKTRDLPVIMLTAVDSESNEIDLLDLGANDFVSKASSSAVMLSRLRKVLLQCH